MAKDGSEYPSDTVLERMPKWLRDAIDLNNEMAERETGRMKRFTASSETNTADTEKKKGARKLDTLLQRLLEDRDYARLYHDAYASVLEAERAVAHAHRYLVIEEDHALKKIERLRDEAAELPDGRKVFRAEGGRLVAEDGTDVTDQSQSVKNISSITPTWKEFKATKEQVADLHRRQVELEHYRIETLEPMRQRLNDPDNPVSAEELRDLPKQLKESMHKDAARFLNGMAIPRQPDAEETDSELSSGVNAPDISSQFRSAASVITGDAFAPPAPGPGQKR